MAKTGSTKRWERKKQRKKIPGEKVAIAAVLLGLALGTTLVMADSAVKYAKKQVRVILRIYRSRGRP
jgi:hypothetical protein